ncbi:MAG TPA: DUF3108 domain-containing protein [Burkholderiales bacterium]|nr:DUF3108 domain-containing protein [Burkholderiales bacterium]
MKRLPRLAALLLCIAPLTPLWAAQPPHRVQMSMEVHTGGMHLGEARDVLEHDGRQYSVVSESKTVGLAAILYSLNVRREAKGIVTKSGLRPLHFQEENSRKPRRSADFDWEARKLTLTDGDKVARVDLPDNAFDQTSFVYAFAFRAPDEELPTVYLTDGRKLSDYTYRLIGKEKIQTAMGELDTVHFQKVRAPDDKRGFDVWLSVDHHYLPVQVRYVEKDGREIDSTVTAISYQ